MKTLRIVFGEEGAHEVHIIYGNTNLRQFFNGFIAWLVLNPKMCFSPESMIKYYEQLPDDQRGELFMPFNIEWLHPSEVPMSIFVYRCFECGKKFSADEGKEIVKIYKESPQYRVIHACNECAPLVEADSEKKKSAIRYGKYTPQE